MAPSRGEIWFVKRELYLADYMPAFRELGFATRMVERAEAEQAGADGHPRPLLISAGGQAVPVEAAGIAIGLVDADMFDRRLQEATVRLHPGDLWVLFTDGVTEAMNAEHKEWGPANLQDAVLAGARAERAAGLPRVGQGAGPVPPKAEGAAAIVARVRQELLAFAGDVAQYDDMTLVVGSLS